MHSEFVLFWNRFERMKKAFYNNFILFPIQFQGQHWSEKQSKLGNVFWCRNNAGYFPNPVQKHRNARESVWYSARTVFTPRHYADQLPVCGEWSTGISDTRSYKSSCKCTKCFSINKRLQRTSMTSTTIIIRNSICANVLQVRGMWKSALKIEKY